MALKDKAARAATRGLLAGAGIILVTAGLGFLTAAIWTVLAEAKDGLFASITVGAGYVTVGSIVLMVVLFGHRSDASHSTHHPTSPPPPTADVTDVMQAFMGGIAQGRSARH